MFNLKGRVAVITGASSGLGKQMARGFAEQGADLVILARRVEKLEELKTELEQKGVRVLPVKCDVTSTEDIDNAAKLAEETFGKVDILVNCAGSSKDKGALEMTDEEWDFTIATDQTSVFKMTRAFGNIMKKNNYGRIINIASMYGMVGNTEIPTIAYHSSKGAVVNYTRAAAAELAKYNIARLTFLTVVQTILAVVMAVIVVKLVKWCLSDEDADWEDKALGIFMTNTML